MLGDAFELAKTNLTNIIEDLKENFKDLPTIKDIDKLPLGRVRDLVEYSKIALSKMDKILAEYYHLIGMYPLNAIQLNMLNKLFREYLSYRHKIKQIANLEKIGTTFNTSTTEYEFNELLHGKIVYNQDTRTCSFSAYASVGEIVKKYCSYTAKGDILVTIKPDNSNTNLKDNLDEFGKALHYIFTGGKCNSSSSLSNKLADKQKVYGITFHDLVDEYQALIEKNSTKFNTFEEYLNK